MTQEERQLAQYKREIADKLAMSFATHIMEELTLDPVFTERADNIGTDLDLLGANGNTVERVNTEIQLMLALAIQKTMRQWMTAGGRYWELLNELEVIPAVERLNISDVVNEDEIQTVISGASLKWEPQANMAVKNMESIEGA